MKMRNFLIIAAACLLAFSSAALAQALMNFSAYDAFDLQFDPRSPGPNTDVKVSIITYTFDADKSFITWTLNGKIVEQGRGKKSINFKTGDIGSLVSLSVFVVADTGRQVEQRLNFKIGEVDLLVQPLTYTPPYYKGSPKAISEALIKVVAIPQGLGATKDLIFEWTRNYENVPDASGLGKNSYTFKSLLVNNPEEKIGVRVSGLNDDFAIERSIKISIDQPEIIFYEEHPLEGPLFAKSLKNEIKIAQPNIVLRAEPYYFPTKDLEMLSYEWQMNNKKIETPSPQNLLGLTSPQESQGYSTINIEIRNPRSLLQRVSAMLKINF